MENYYCYYEPSEDGKYNEVYVVSESNIRKDFYPEWQEKMIKKYGEEKAKDFGFSDCVNDFCCIHGAWKA